MVEVLVAQSEQPGVRQERGDDVRDLVGHPVGDQVPEHVQRLEQVLSELGKKSGGETCEAMKGLIEEGEEIIDDVKQSPLRDAGLIAAANRVEHYEMAGYGTARAYATILGDEEASDLLQQTLEEEKEADQELTSLAESINEDAAVKAVEGERTTGTRKKRVA